MTAFRSATAQALVALLTLHAAPASITLLDPSYSFTTYHAHSVSSSAIVSFDWDTSDQIYYQTSTSFFNFGGLYRWDGTTQTTEVAGSSDFSGASVIRIGDYLYYNTSDFTNQNIFRFGPLSGSPSSTNISTAENWGLFRRGPGEIFITGAIGFGTNEIFYTTLDSAGNFTAAPVSLGLTIGSSGPIAFDLAGNLYYAPGFGDLSIYKYTAADIAAAIADPITNPLPSAASRLWWDYSADFTVSGATGLAFDDDGNLLITLTDFINPSFLLSVTVDSFGNFDDYTSILSSTGRLGDIRFKDGTIYLANDNEILAVVPEPSTLALLGLGLLAALWTARRRPLAAPRA